MPGPVLVWDFDGVLNANCVAGRFVWADRLAQDWGIDRDALAQHLFAPDRLAGIMRGQRDLRDELAQWFAQTGQQIDADAFLAYWFARDAHTDPAILPHLDRTGCRHVIGTNNEARRAAYVETEMGYATRVERIFASGRMGCAKPDTAFFAQIERWSGAAPFDHVLIDDTLRNVAAAQAKGWRTFHFTDATRDGLAPFLDTLW